MQESRKQNVIARALIYISALVMPYEQTRVTLRALVNINDLLTPSRAIVRVACELLTSLEMSIVNSALYLIILSGDLC
jgi:hypothetical protein